MAVRTPTGQGTQGGVSVGANAPAVINGHRNGMTDVTFVLVDITNHIGPGMAIYTVTVRTEMGVVMEAIVGNRSLTMTVGTGGRHISRSHTLCIGDSI